MKRFLMLLMIAAMLFSLAACGSAPDEDAANGAAAPSAEAPGGAQAPEAPDAPDAEATGDTLVAFFSRADENYSVGFIEKGNTHIIAEMIADEIGGELFHIQRSEPYPESYDACVDAAKQEQAANARPKLKEDIDVAKYDVIYLGYPIWCGDMPMAVYTFLEGHDFSGKTIIPFCTNEGSGVSGTDKSIAKACPGASVLTALAIRGSIAQNSQDEARESVRDWLKENGYEASTPKLSITIGETVLTAAFADNSSAEALGELLAAGPLTIQMSDYGGFEKVGELGAALARNDESITTEPGDLILYQGSRFAIYYGTNTWDFTRLGKIDGLTAQELKGILGEGDVTAILSLAG